MSISERTANRGDKLVNCYIKNLIQRMCITEKVSNSDVSISFLAHREAEQLLEVEFIPFIIEFIKLHTKPKERRERSSAYFILGKLLMKLENPTALQFLINQIRTETDKYIISSLLDRIADIEKPSELDIEPIIESVRSEKWLVRHSAINALKKSRNPRSRLILINYLESIEDFKKYKHDIAYAISVLSDIGELDDILVLERYLKSTIRDIRQSSEYAIKTINERNAIS